MTVSWFTTLLRMEAIAPEFAQSLELPLGVLRAYSPHITILGLFVVVGWRNRRGGVGTRRCVEVTVEMVRCRRCPLSSLLTDVTCSPRHKLCPMFLDI